MIAGVVKTILSVEMLSPPEGDVKKRFFDPQLVMWGASSSFPNHFMDSFKDWEKYVCTQQVEGEVIEYIIPNYLIHGDACNNVCHGTYKAAITNVMDREFGSGNTLDVLVF